MNYYVFFNEHGQILFMNNGRVSYPDLNLIMIGETPINISEYYVVDNKLVALPKKPDSNEYWIFDYGIKGWIANIGIASNNVKLKREVLLASSDWTQLSNNPLTEEKQIAWSIYRQELRDITKQLGYPTDLIWPVKPE